MFDMMIAAAALAVSERDLHQAEADRQEAEMDRRSGLHAEMGGDADGGIFSLMGGIDGDSDGDIFSMMEDIDGDVDGDIYVPTGAVFLPEWRLP